MATTCRKQLRQKQKKTAKPSSCRSWFGTTSLLLVVIVATRMLTENTGSFFVRQNEISVSCPIPYWTYPDCRNLTSTKIPAMPDVEFLELRKIYVSIVGPDMSTLAPVSWLQQRHINDGDGDGHIWHGFEVAVEVRESPGKGNGVFALEDIPHGAKVWDNRYTARFFDECSVRQFLAALSNTQACQALHWSYLYDFGLPRQQQLGGASHHRNPPQVNLDLDHAMYMNDGRGPHANVDVRLDVLNVLPEIHHHPPTSPASPYYFTEEQTPGALGVYARHNISAGTELLVDYTDIHTYASLWWYDKLLYHSMGLHGYLTMH